MTSQPSTESSSATGPSSATEPHETQYYKKDFWQVENPKYLKPHYRLEKAARTANRVAGDKTCDLLDLGCGPATLARLLRPNINYYGIDIAIQEPAPNLLEADLLEAPIRFGDRSFDIVLAQGLFEYLGEYQSQKFHEISEIIRREGTFIVSYVNFDHRDREIYWPYSNIQPAASFRASLSRYFLIHKCFPTSYNWNHSEPNRKLLRTANMHMNLNIPVLTSRLAVEHFYICSVRQGV
jgi:SAM-dependent methyltransferase